MRRWGREVSARRRAGPLQARAGQWGQRDEGASPDRTRGLFGVRGRERGSCGRTRRARAWMIDWRGALCRGRRGSRFGVRWIRRVLKTAAVTECIPGASARHGSKCWVWVVACSAPQTPSSRGCYYRPGNRGPERLRILSNS